MTEEIKKILELINEDKRLIEKADICRDGGLHLNVTGICEQQKGYMAAALAMREGKKPVVIVPDIAAARAFETSIRPFIDGETVVLAPADLSLVSAVASSREPGTMRAGAVARISEGDFGAAIICAGALINRMMPKAVYDRNVLSISRTLHQSLSPWVMRGRDRYRPPESSHPEEMSRTSLLPTDQVR